MNKRKLYQDKLEMHNFTQGDPLSSREDRQVKISSKKTQCKEKNPQFLTRLYVLGAAGTC